MRLHKDVPPYIQFTKESKMACNQPGLFLHTILNPKELLRSQTTLSSTLKVGRKGSKMSCEIHRVVLTPRDPKCIPMACQSVQSAVCLVLSMKGSLIFILWKIENESDMRVMLEEQYMS